jgi:hypothetical protein
VWFGCWLDLKKVTMKKIFPFLAMILFLQACEIEQDEDTSRADFLGLWTCTETEGELAPQTYAIEIYAIGLGNSVGITGLYNQGGSFILNGDVSGRNLSIPLQSVDGISIGGSGTMSFSLDKITLNFTANDGSGNDQVVASCVR